MSLADAVRKVQEADVALVASAPEAVPIGIGPLASIVAGTVVALHESDWWIPGMRERAGGVLRGVPAARLDNARAGARPYHVGPATPSPALRALHAVGLALTLQEACVAVHLGTGSVADGAFAEALNLASLTGAHVVFVVAWLDLTGAPVPAQSAATPIALAKAYGVHGTAVDGTSAEAVHTAVLAARQRKGPSLVQASLPAPSA